MSNLKKCPNLFIPSYCDCKDGECQATKSLEQKQLITEVMNDDAKDGMYKQQTAVSWLIDRLLDGSLRFEETDMGFLISMNNDEIEKAKAMEKEQIKYAYNMGAYRQKIYEELDLTAAENYYNNRYE